MSGPFLTPPQVAERLGVDRNKVLGWIHRGDLPAVDLSSGTGGRPRWRVDPAELEQFLARRRSPAAPVKKSVRRQKPSNVVPFFS